MNISNHATQRAGMQEHERKMLKNETKAQNQIPLNPLNFSPIGIDFQNGWKIEKANIIRAPP